MRKRRKQLAFELERLMLENLDMSILCIKRIRGGRAKLRRASERRVAHINGKLDSLQHFFSDVEEPFSWLPEVSSFAPIRYEPISSEPIPSYSLTLNKYKRLTLTITGVFNYPVVYRTHPEEDLRPHSGNPINRTEFYPAFSPFVLSDSGLTDESLRGKTGEHREKYHPPFVPIKFHESMPALLYDNDYIEHLFLSHKKGVSQALFTRRPKRRLKKR